MRYFQIGLLAVVLCLPFMADAQVFVRPGGAGAQNGTSWGNAYASIQAAVNDANAAAQDVWVAAGTYNEWSILWATEVAAYGGFPVGATALSQRDFVNTPSTINANSNGRCITITSGSNIRIDGFTLTNGNAASNPENGGGWGGAIWVSSVDATTIIANCVLSNSYAAAHGGGALVQGANPRFEGCTFSGNGTGNFGGGLFNHYGTGSLINCIFTGNSAANGGGAAHWTPSVDHVVTGCTFTSNTTPSNGGAIVSGNGAIVTVTGSTFTGNQAVNGGAIYSGFGASTIALNTSSFVTNTVSNLGGAVFADGGGSVTSDGSLFEGNTATQHGGAVALWPGAETRNFSRCTFRGNQAGSGGGAIFHHGPNNSGGLATMNLQNCIFDRNYAAGWIAGGVATWNIANTGVQNCTFSGNNGVAGGGALFTGDGGSTVQVFVTNSILAGNVPNQLVDNTNGTTFVANSIIFGQAWGGATNADPQFLNAAAGDVRVAGTSPAIDTGVSAAPSIDILGTPRPQGGNADMGAYERDTTPPGIIISGPSTALTNTGPVTYTVTYSDYASISLVPGNVSLNATGGTGAAVGVSGSGATRTVTLSSITGTGSLGISLAAGTAADWAGNTAPAAGPSSTFNVDNTPPNVTSITPATTGPTNANSVAFTVQFSENVTNFGSSDLQINHNGTAHLGVNINPAAGPASQYTVTVGVISGDGNFTLQVLNNTSARDAANNLVGTGMTSAAVQIDNTPPTPVWPAWRPRISIMAAATISAL
jgi:predicted outer membrane repeat protein